MSEQIVIDLSKARNPQELDANNIIQKEAQERFESIVGRILNNINHERGNSKRKVPEYAEYCQNYKPKGINSSNNILLRSHNTITINGGRGTGKTTFLLNVIRKDSNEFDDIEVLKIIDPTLVEDKEHVLVAIISSIKDVVDDYRKNRNNNCSDEKFRYWNEKLRELARGLCLLDGVGSDPLKKNGWDDPNYILQEGLKNASSGAKLEKAFHEFVAETLKVIDKKAFLLLFDDIDTNFKRGWPVLEIIRKYLTTPKIITVLSGDMSLYSKLVRKNQWENFGKEFIYIEGKAKFFPIVDKLEEQYLMKILRPENRIELKSLKYYLDKAKATGKKISVKEIESDNSDNELKKVFEEICNKLFGIVPEDTRHVELYTNCFLRQPVRTIIEVLLSYYEYKNKCAQGSKEKVYARKFAKDVALIFLTTLYKFKYTMNDIDNILDPDRCEFGELTQKLAEFNMLEDNYKLLPENTDESKNILMIALSALYSQAMKGNPILMMDYFIKVGLAREIWAHKWTGEGDPKKDPKTDSKKDFKDEFINDIIPFLHLDKQELALQVSRRFTAFKGQTNLEDHDHGIVSVSSVNYEKFSSRDFSPATRNVYSVKGESLTEIRKNIEKTIINHPSLKEYFRYHKNQNLINSRLIVPARNLRNTLNSSWISNYIDVLFSYRVGNKGNSETRLFYSFFNLLSVALDASIFEKYDGVVQIRDFPAYKAESNSDNGNEIEITESQKGENAETELAEKKVRELYKTWIAKGESLPAFPIYFWANIWTRFFYTISRISTKQLAEDGKVYFGEIIHRDIVAFLHAVLMEELLFTKEYKKGNRLRKFDNPVKSDSNFNDHLIKWFDKIKRNYREETAIKFNSNKSSLEHKKFVIKENSDKGLNSRLVLFDFIFACPLWKTFLAKEEIGWQDIYDLHIKHYLELEVDESDLEFLRGIGLETQNGELCLNDVLNVVPMAIQEENVAHKKSAPRGKPSEMVEGIIKDRDSLKKIKARCKELEIKIKTNKDVHTEFDDKISDIIKELDLGKVSIASNNSHIRQKLCDALNTLNVKQ